MTTMTYDRLERVSHSNPPYRGTVNRFPLYTRKENTKYFLVREEDGQKVFDIVYGQRWDAVSITEEEFNNPNAARVYSHNNNYFKYVAKPNIMGTVRFAGDDAHNGQFHFTAKSYGQGERGFLSQGYSGWFSTDSRRGGMLLTKRDYQAGRTKTMYPIYSGMKVDARTMNPLTPHEVVINYVDRKKSKHLVKEYENFFKVSEVMLKSLTMDAVFDTAKQLLDEVHTNHGEVLLHEAKDRIKTAPLDAFLLYCMGYGVGRLMYQVKYPQSRGFHGMSGSDIAYGELFMNVKRKITKEIYLANPDVFKEVKYEYGQEYPASDWGTKVFVNGQEMMQYQ